jgi:ElaA protein
MTSLPEIGLRWQGFAELTSVELYELLRFRQQIFVVEQGSPYPDLDGLDGAAWHLAARATDGVVTGYLRLLPPGPSPSVRIGRVAVLGRLRGAGLGRRLVEAGLVFGHTHYPGQALVLDAQQQLVRFYEGFGFRATGSPYDDFGVAHVAMVRAAGYR